MPFGSSTCYYCHDTLKTGEGNNPNTSSVSFLDQEQLCCNTCNENVVVPLRIARAFATEMTVYSEFYWNSDRTILISFERKYVTISRPLSELQEWKMTVFLGIPVIRNFKNYQRKPSVKKEYKECDRSGLSPEETYHFNRGGNAFGGSHIDKLGNLYTRRVIPRPPVAVPVPVPVPVPVVSEEEVLALFAEPSKKKKERTLTAEQEQRRLTREANREKERQKAEKDAFYAKKFGVKFVKAKASSGDIAK